MYSQKLRDHYHTPRNRGELDKPDFQTESYNPSCGDEIRISGKISEGVVRDLKFSGKGCMISQAAASLLTELAIGMPLDRVCALSDHDMQDMIGMPLGPNRLKCVTLSLLALQEGAAKSVNNA